MRHARPVLAAACLALTLAGCETTGLSMREAQGRDYSRYLQALTPRDEPRGQRRELRAPMRLAVAQFGEVAPPTSMMDKLRAEGGLLADVQSVPAVMPERTQWSRRHEPAATQPAQARAEDRELMARLQGLARDVGAEHLLVFGGSIDYGTRETPLSGFDLTIVGAFVVPSREIVAESRASAALLDLDTGRAALIVDADGAGKRIASAVGAEADEQKLLAEVRDQTVAELTRRFIDACRRATAGDATR